MRGANLSESELVLRNVDLQISVSANMILNPATASQKNGTYALTVRRMPR